MVEILDITLPKVPQRSQLYSLEPIGLGTPLSESLTSYIVRLSLAHCLPVKYLFSWIVMSLVNRPYLQSGEVFDANILPKRFTSSVHCLNGKGEIAEDWVRALEELTCRRGLSYLTMLPWRNVMPDQGLIRKHKAWCPECFTAWQQSGKELYEPLIWKLIPVAVCPTHKRALEVKCSHCKKHLPQLTSNSLCGHCSRCSQWLGATDKKGECDLSLNEDFDYYLWAAQDAGRLVAGVPSLSCPPLKWQVKLALEITCNRMADGNMSAFARFINAKYCSRILKKNITHEFEMLLNVCFKIGISIYDFIIKLGDPRSEFKDTFDWAKVKLPQSTLHIKREKVRDVLRVALKEDPPPSLNDLAERLGYKLASSLEGIEPNLCSRVKLRYSVFTKSNACVTTHSKNGADGDAIERALHRAIKTDPPPSLEEISRAFGYSSNSSIRYRFFELCFALKRARRRYRYRHIQEIKMKLKRMLQRKIPISLIEVSKKLGYTGRVLRAYAPDLCKEIVEKYVEYKMLRKDVKQRLLEALKINPPQSVRAVARNIRITVSTLYAKFPYLCRQISARFKAFRVKCSRLKQQELFKEVHRVVSMLIVDGLYPSQSRVVKLLTLPISMKLDEFQKMCKKIRETLKAKGVQPLMTGGSKHSG